MQNDPRANAFQTAFDQEMEHGARSGSEDELDQRWVTQEMEHGARPGTEEEEELVQMVTEKDAPPPRPPSGPVPTPYPNFGVEHDGSGQMIFDDFGA
jgi:hypothetical protein